MEPMATMSPRPRACMAGRKARTIRKGATRLTSSAAVKSSRDVCATGARRNRPALFTMMSGASPKRSRTDVAWHGMRPGTQLMRARLELGRTSREHDDAGARLHQRAGDGEADTARGTRDNGE